MYDENKPKWKIYDLFYFNVRMSLNEGYDEITEQQIWLIVCLHLILYRKQINTTENIYEQLSICTILKKHFKGYAKGKQQNSSKNKQTKKSPLKCITLTEKKILYSFICTSGI